MGGKRSDFTGVELVFTLALVVILVVVLYPRIIRSGSSGKLDFLNETRSVLQYAHKTALAKQRRVCLAFTATAVSLTIASAQDSPICDAPLAGPSGEAAPYILHARNGATFSTLPTNFSFNAQGQPCDNLGQPRSTQMIAVADAGTITIDADSGKVR